jgi:tRNA uridine 5-carbamoylmethylation protein Kti12
VEAFGRDPVLIVTGPPGAGKTAASRLLARASPRAVHLESDHFFHFIASGYVEPWLPESREQNTAVMRIVADAAAGYAGAGYFTIVDGIVSPRWFFEPLRDRLRDAGHAVAYAILRPSLETCVSRASDRSPAQLADPAVVEQLWHQFAGLGPLERHVIDTGDETAAQTAETLAQHLRDGRLSC